MTIDLLATLHIVEDDVTAVVDAYMANPQRGTVRFGEGFEIDPAVALTAHPFASELIGQPWAGEGYGAQQYVPRSCWRVHGGLGEKED